ncbi:biopolymer transporter ExbD [Acinetobacter gandensis]|nr:biopolymer transporter ExbD [Acinetobacter gandensis]
MRGALHFKSLCNKAIPNNSINIDLPNGTPPPTNEKPPEPVTLKIDAQGKLFWNGQAVANKQALETLFAGVAQQADQDTIKVQPDKMTEYKDVAMVMAAAQRLNVKKIGVSANQ